MTDAEFEVAEIAYESTPQPFEVKCNWCLQVQTVQITIQEHLAWRRGAFVQDAFPNLTPGERELFISGTCETCFDRMFPAE